MGKVWRGQDFSVLLSAKCQVLKGSQVKWIWLRVSCKIVKKGHWPSDLEIEKSNQGKTRKG